MSRDVKQIIVIRKDLQMRRGKEIAQGSHASMAFIMTKIRNSKPIPGKVADMVKIALSKEFWKWITSGTTKICVRVDSEEELQKVYNAAEGMGLEVHMITDAGRTDAGNGKGNPTNTCLAIGPNYADEIDKITGKEGSNPCKLY